MSRGSTLLRRLRERPLLWLLAAVAALAFILIGLRWLDDRLVQTAARETWAQRIIIIGGVGVVVAEAARRWRWWLGLAMLMGTIVFTVVLVDEVVKEVRLERYSDADGRPPASGPPIDAIVQAAPQPAGALARDQWDNLDISLEPILTGLTQPMAVEAIPGTDDYFVVQREGEIRRITEGGSEGELLLDLSSETSLDGERGFFDIALSPADGRLYVSFSDLEGDNQVISFATDGDQLSDRLDVIEVVQPFRTHNGGALEFDASGYLLLGIGDGGRLRDPLDAGQDTATRLGTILRIAPQNGGGYAIPPDNPLLAEPGTWPEIYAFGLRNPWRMSVDSLTGDIWIGDVGQDGFEEANLIPFASGGQNFGWSRTEGPGVHTGNDTASTGFTDADIPSDNVWPTFFYAHDPEGVEGARNSITGGYIYRGDDIEILQGTYVYADFSASILAAALIDDGAVEAERILLDDVPAPVSLGVDHDGELLVVSLAGEISRLQVG